MNWVDWVIIAIVLVFLFDGFQAGFLALVSGFIGFATALWVALLFHDQVGTFFITHLGLAGKWKDIVGYIVIIGIVQISISQLLIISLRRVVNRFWPRILDAILGAGVAVVNTIISITLVLLLIMAFSFSSSIKNPVKSSVLSQKFLTLADLYAKPLKDSVEQTALEAAKFMTIRPNSEERIILEVKPQAWELVNDEIGERKMIELINAERIKRGVVEISVDLVLTDIARNHSRDMFIRQYFSHVSPEGKTLKDRLEEVKYSYSQAAENLAYAPTVEVAHLGLMDSEGHRKNILDPSLTRIGMGIIDAGVNGKMFTQVFVDGGSLIQHYP